jgi:hypothetical protein
VDDTCCTALIIEKKEILRKGVEVERGGYFFDSVRDLGLVADVTRVKGRVMIALDDVKYGHWITTRDQSLNDMPTEKTATADDEESVALRGGHETREQDGKFNYFEYRLTFWHFEFEIYATT